MRDASLRPDPTLAEWLAAHARLVTVRRLALDVVAGALVAGAAALARPRGWPALLGAALCFVSFGAWAAAERRLTALLAPPVPGALTARDSSVVVWRALRAVAGVVGALAAALALFGFLFGVLGTWIS